MKTIDFNKLTVRASQIHRIMANMGLTEAQERDLAELQAKPKLTEIQAKKLQELYIKQQNPSFPDGFINYAIELYKQLVYGRVLNFENQKTKKGTEQEGESINTYSIFKDKSYEKNQKRMYNSHFEGECDIKNDRETIDIKSSFNLFTHPSRISYSVTNAYLMQGQVYMDLFETDKHTVAHVLSNSSQDMIERELHLLRYENLNDYEFQIQAKEIEKNHIVDLERFQELYPDYIFYNELFEFEEIPLENRILEHSFTRDEVLIHKMKERVELFRAFIIDNHKNF